MPAAFPAAGKRRRLTVRTGRLFQPLLPFDDGAAFDQVAIDDDEWFLIGRCANPLRADAPTPSSRRCRLAKSGEVLASSSSA